jgi:predicted transcriptional regulator of viral defense system
MRGKIAQRPADGTDSAADRRIASLAAKQFGVVSTAQLLGAGLTRRQVDYRLALRRLHTVHRGVYAVGHPLLGPEGHDLAAVLACGRGAVLSHRSAAAHWGVRPSATATVDVIVPGRGGRARRKRIGIHRVQLSQAEVTVHDGIPVTTVARTLLDLAAVVSPHGLARAIHGAERVRLFDLRAVEEALRRNAGRPGSRALAAALERYREPPMTRSALERVLSGCARRMASRPRP